MAKSPAAKSPVERWGSEPPRPRKSTKATETTAALEQAAELPNDQPEEASLSDTAAGFVKEQLKSFIERIEHEAIVDLYMQALGMIPFERTPLGQTMEG